MALATLSIDLVAQLGRLEAGLDKAGRLAEKSANEIARKFAVLQKGAVAIGAALAPVAAVAGIRAFITSTVDGVDKLNDLADATGSTVELMSALEDAAARTGTSVDVVGDAVVRMNRTIADAKEGSAAANTLKAIGLNAEELRRLDPADALHRISLALAGFADDGHKARIVQELFGKSVKEVAPLLKDLAEQGQLNATVTTEQAEAADKFKRQTAELDKNLTDLSRTIAGAVIPALNKLFDRVKREGFFSALFAPDEQAKLIGQARVLEQQITLISTKLTKAIDRKDGEAATALRTQLETLLRESARISDLLKGTPSTVGGGRSPRDLLRGIEAGAYTRPSLPGVPDATPKPAARERTFVDAIDTSALRRALAAIEATDASKIRDLEASLSELFELQRETRGDPAVVAAIAATRAELEALGTKALPDPEPLKAYRDAIAAIEGTDAAQIREVSAALDELFQLRDLGVFGPEVDEAIAKLRDRLKELREPVAEVSEFAREASRNIQDALGQSVLESMSGTTRGIADIWKNMLKRMVAEAAAARLAEVLLGKGFGTTTSSTGGLVGSAISYIGSLFGGKFADGGILGAGKWGIAGERGPEIIRGPAQVVPMAQMAGGPAMVVNVQGDFGATAQRAVELQIRAYEARNLRRGAY